jgi:hypothetical protein
LNNESREIFSRFFYAQGVRIKAAGNIPGNILPRRIYTLDLDDVILSLPVCGDEGMNGTKRTRYAVAIEGMEYILELR